MTEHFKVLNDEEYKSLTDAISLITLLIAGADGDVEKEELDWATKIAKIRSYALPEKLNDFYKDVGSDFSERLDHFTHVTSSAVTVRMGEISDRLEKLNPILAKLPQALGATLYNSYTTFAKHVAKSSGGFLGFFAVGPEEEKWISLPMLMPIEMPEEEEEA